MLAESTFRTWARRTASLVLLALACSSVIGRSFAAGEASDLYQATTIVTGTDMRSRPSGFAQCLREVLVKVSGEPRLSSDPRVADLASRADVFVTSFTYVDPRANVRPHDDQGTYDRSQNLTVVFDRAKVDDALAKLGELPWPGPRPTIVPFVALRSAEGPWKGEFLLAADETSASVQRDSFLNSAGKYGMRARFPAGSDYQAWGMGPEGPVPDIPSKEGEMLVRGVLEFRPDAMGWVGLWYLRWHGASYAWKISGVGFDQAFDDLVAGAVRVASGHGAPD